MWPDTDETAPLSPRNMVDKDHDGRINVSEFCAAMSLIRQAQKQEGGLLGSSQGVQFFQREPAPRQQSFAQVRSFREVSPY